MFTFSEPRDIIIDEFSQQFYSYCIILLVIGTFAYSQQELISNGSSFFAPELSGNISAKKHLISLIFVLFES